MRATVERLGLRLAEALGGAGAAVVLGGDTRASTPEICRWLAAGLARGGAVVRYAGTLPTPGIAHLVVELGADCGVAVSASHNPLPDNGIKLIDRDGFKWEPAAERELEERLAGTAGGAAGPLPGLDVEPALVERYRAALARQLGGERPLAGLAVVVDAANGAASALARPLFEELGARVTALADRPDGSNINRESGSTHPAAVARATAAGGADVGIAFDGDADRAVFADERGEVRDGDAILYLWARALAAAGELAPPRIVATTMSNVGLVAALGAEGIEVVRCPVGDRAVVETLRREGILLGGEQSGHIVHLGLGPTGDGLRTALAVASIVRAAGRPLSELLAGFRRFPQVLVNVRVASKPDLDSLPRIAAAARSVEEKLGDAGRLVLRYSGTEPLARVMIEGEDQAEIEALAAGLAGVIGEELGGERRAGPRR